ncbi:MAG: hypothetical protein A2Y94_10645 [Caldithrix sp. RBG_13_44_9]|nr:MAG: hypothetical protein A2Y94_10645 [Caldithrix sp. RBG_13_44_9]
MRRRDFLKYSVAAGSGALILGRPFELLGSQPDAVVVTGGEPINLINTALQNYGGIQRFISKGDIVVIKPNMGWDRAPEFAANSNPALISELTRLCFEAGAAKVKIFDRTCNNPQRCYQNSQIEASAKKLGAEVEQIRDFKFKKISLPSGTILKEWPIYQDYLEADKIINVPIAKHHSLSTITLGLKNLMGVMGGSRGEIHNSFRQKLIDIDTHILPTLTVVDAYRILLRNGPNGGNLNDVKLAKTLIVSSCAVSADVLGLELFQQEIKNVGYIQEAIDRGLNKFDIAKLNVQRINLS